MKPWVHAHGTTAAAIVVALALTVSCGYVAVQSILDARDPGRIDPEFRRNALAVAGSPGGNAGNASAIAGIVIGAAVAVCAFAIVGMAGSRSRDCQPRCCRSPVAPPSAQDFENREMERAGAR